MGFGRFEQKSHLAPMAEINVTPMVDVMLVLLVIFIITAPLLTHSIKLDLPDAPAAVAAPEPDTITLSIDGRGLLFWDTDLLTFAQLEQRLAKVAKREPQPSLQIRADNDTRYEVMAKVLAAAQNSGMNKLGFVTDPKPDAGAGATNSAGAASAAQPVPKDKK
jgi:biopolymer transport protein ExbD